MSVVSKNPFDLLDDDGDSSPTPAAKSTPQTTAASKKAPNASSGTAQRNVPGSAPRGGGGQRGGRYPSRGGPRNVYREDNGPRNTGPDPASGTTEGMEGPGGFEGERVAPPKKAHQGPDKHTKGPREFRENRRGNGDGFGDRRPRGGHRGGRVPTDGGERRHFERRSGGLPDSQKKVDQGWGSNDGPRELDAEEEGEKDAQAEENAPQTPAGDDGGWGAADADEAPKSGGFSGEAAEEEAAEPEEVQKTYEQYLAEKAEQALNFGKKEGRTVTAETLEGKAFVREAVDDFFSGKEKNAAGKARGPKKEKVFIEVDGQFAAPPRSGRGGDRGGRGGGRGRGGDRGVGRGRGGGAPRGRGGFGGSRPAQGLDGSDDRAFPALGA